MSDPKPKMKRCAIYTRKSSEEGLEQEFNSLHAQREACEAFVKSQAGEGWRVLPAEYDDGGISGGTMERPALTALLADIEAGHVDVVVVYKVDRLTRSLSDFAKIIEVFDRRGASFVAVTQQFNTTSSMGRLTLNILLSFAQFEREVTGERIRDKIAASKRKGMWMGGLPPLGYDALDRKLVVNGAEAEQVRFTFMTYNELGSVAAVEKELATKRMYSKARIRADGRPCGNVPIARGNLNAILRNPVYRGQIRHKGVLHTGQHSAIIDEDLWQETQARLDGNRQGNKRRPTSRDASSLQGKLTDEAGDRLVPSYARKGSRKYRYYISHFLLARGESETRRGWRVPAGQLEQMVTTATAHLLKDTTSLATAWRASGIPFGQFPTFATDLCSSQSRELPKDQVLAMVESVQLKEDGLSIRIDASSIVTGIPVLVHNVPITISRRGIEMRLVMDAHEQPAEQNRPLMNAIYRGHNWFDEIARDKVSAASIAEREGVTAAYVGRMIRLAFLSPKIVKAVMAGRQPAAVNVDAVINDIVLAKSWPEQEAQLGF